MSKQLLEHIAKQIEGIQNDINDLRKDFHGLIWKVVSISSVTGAIGAILALVFHK